jgi:RND family efflux transporter MFP subunit
MKRFPWRLLILILIVLGAGGAAWWWFSRPTPVETTQAHIGPAVEIVYATGVVEPRHPADVAARVTAPVVAVLAKDGERVRAGQTLVRLEDSQQRALLAQAIANRIKAERDAARTQTLFDQGWLTRTALDTALAGRDATRASEAASRAALDQFVVRATAGGIVLKRNVEPGELASPATTLFVIGDPDDLWVTATVDERDVPRLVAGQEALMRSDAWPDRVIPGRLLEVTPGGDALQRAFRARILFARPETVPIGLSLEVNLVTRRHERALLVESSAVTEGRVWTIADGRARRRPVRTGIEAAEDIEIVSGLRAGEAVIVHPPEGLKDGDRVQAQAPPASGKAP